MVNAQPCTMGGIIDYGVGIATKSSPRTQAIEKVQEELRQKCNVRGECWRELEFLEKGGNPLDFKYAHVATASVPSASLTNQIPEKNVISEAKGSFSSLPHGDSLESNDRPGSSLCNETDAADSEGKSDIVADKVIKRGNAAKPKHSMSTDSNRSARKTEDSGLSHLVVKRQAYVRRNRSKPSKESANVFSIRHSVAPAKGYKPRDEKGGAQRIKSHEPDSKPAGSYSENTLNNAGSDDRETMELHEFQNVCESDCLVKNESKAEEVASIETADANLKVSIRQCPDANSKVSTRQCDSSASTHDEKESSAGDEKAVNNHLDKCVGHIHVKLDKKMIVPSCAIEDSGVHQNAVDPLCKGTKFIVDDHVAEDINLVVTDVDSKSHDDLDNSRYSNKTLEESDQTEGFIKPTPVKVSLDLVQPESVKDAMEVCDSAIVVDKDTRCPSSGCNMNIEGSPASDRKNGYCLRDPISVRSTAVGTDLPKNHEPDAIPSLKSDEPNVENEIKKSENLDKMAKKAFEDSILRDARTIEANIKRADERLLYNTSLEMRRKNHWNFVLEEMSWMANDFMQERLWKNEAASQMCRWIASDGRAKFEEANIQRKQKMIMNSLAKGIMSFWRSAEAGQTACRTVMMQEHNSTMVEEIKASEIKAVKEHGNKSLGAGESLQSRQSQIRDYAVRFLEYNCKSAEESLVLAEAPPTPDRLNDFGILKVSDQLTEESLFYTVASGAMVAYRESVESLFEYHKRAGNTELMDEYEASVCDSAADFPRDDTYEEDEGETCTYLSPEAYGSGSISKMYDKKKHQMHKRISGARQYKIGTYMPHEPCLESKSGNCPLLSNGKRSSRRTAARQRVVSSFHAGATRAPYVTCKTDASSGDTNSLQDDESSLHGGSLQWRNMDYESTGDFDRRLPYDAGEVSTKGNKKKKFNNLGYKTAQNTANSYAPSSVKFQSHMYDQRQQFEDYLKKRPEGHQNYSNGISVTNCVPHASKKLKIMKHGMDNLPEASRVASQMSNMANPARYIKIVANRDRRRKWKTFKMTFSDGWSSIEDQALVHLVHDMGENWEVVSDAINSIVPFKSVHRQPDECKERHKVLMYRSSGNGADSAEDSLTDIPEGSARQVLEFHQRSFVEENIMEHFEKIILLMQQVHSRNRQGDSQELKPIMQPHSSHVITLSQTCMNKLSGDCLTPLDLCDIVSPKLDSVTPGSLSLGSHTNGLTLPNHQGPAGPSTPTSNLNSRLPGAPGRALGNNLTSSSTWNNHRDAQKYSGPGLTSLLGDKQPKIQFNQVISSRNVQQPGGSVPGLLPTGIDRSRRMMPSDHMAGLNQGMPAAKSGIPRISTSGGLAASSGNLVPNSRQGVPSPVNFHPGGISQSGNSKLQDPFDALDQNPGDSMEEHKQVSDMHTQVSQGSSRTSHVSCINPSASKVAMSSPVKQPPQPQQMSPSSHMFGKLDHSRIQASASPLQRAHALHLPKEKQTQHVMPQQNNVISGASAASCVQSCSDIVQQNQGSAVNPVPCLQPQHHQEQAPENPPDASSSPNLPTDASLQKQKKHQGHQQSRQNLQQRNHGSQQAKLMKSLGRGNMVIPQTPPGDNMPANAVSTPSKNHVPDKELMQHIQGFPPANTAPTPSMLQPMNQPKPCTILPQSLKQLPDIGNQSGMQASWSQNLSDSQQPPVHSKSTLNTQERSVKHLGSLMPRE